MSKPREWFAVINLTRQEGVIKRKDWGVQYEQNVEHVRLIEYSAYETAIQRAERAESTSDQYHDKIQSLIKERDEAIADGRRLAREAMSSREIYLDDQLTKERAKSAKLADDGIDTSTDRGMEFIHETLAEYEKGGAEK